MDEYVCFEREEKACVWIRMISDIHRDRKTDTKTGTTQSEKKQIQVQKNRHKNRENRHSDRKTGPTLEG